MEAVGNRLKALRNTTGLSQEAFGETIGATQSAINRYENNQAEAPYRVLLSYADHFDVSMDYIFCRTDNPQGKLYEYSPDTLKQKMANKKEWLQLLETCFEEGTPMNAKLKESLINLIDEEK